MENNFSNEDCILITRIFLNKSKKILKLSIDYEKNKDLDLTIASARPPIFWKEKEITKQQILNWSPKNMKKLLYKINNINTFIKNVSLTSDNTNCCDFVTADGGFDFSENYNTQENDFIIFLICEIYIIFNILKDNGNAVIKLYDIYSRNSMKILYILTLFFDEVFIIKPFSSRPANSEKYVLCKSFKMSNENLDRYKERFKNIIVTKNLNLLDDSIPYKFIKLISEYNKFYTERQILYIRSTLSLIEKINNQPITSEEKNKRIKQLTEAIMNAVLSEKQINIFKTINHHIGNLPYQSVKILC